MARTREVSWEWGENVSGIVVPAHSEMRPESAIQALMECAPHVDPETSRQELAPLRDVIVDMIHLTLDDRELWIFEALFYRRLSLRQLSRELALSKTHLARLRDEITMKLRVALGAHPTIRSYLQGTERPQRSSISDDETSQEYLQP